MASLVQHLNWYTTLAILLSSWSLNAPVFVKTFQPIVETETSE